MTTVALISDAAFDGVSAAITDAVRAVTVTRETRGAYNVTTGAYALTTATETGRCVLDTVKPVTDIFPAYTIGPRDQLFLIEGVTSVREADKLTIGGQDYRVGAVQDIVGAGSLFYVIAQEVPT